MKKCKGSASRGTRHITLSALLLCATGQIAVAETIATVNGANIDSVVLDFYIQSRTNRPADQVSPQERDTLTSELTDIFLLSTVEAAAKFERDPQIQAQLELQRRGILAQAVAADFYATATVSESDIASEYEKQAKLAPAIQYKARHILVETQNEAIEIIASLDDGKDFIEMARTQSTGPSGPNGGDLGWFSSDQMVKPFSDAVAGLDDGAYTKQPVQTQYGWHVILREESRATEAPTLESARDGITQYLQNQRFQVYLQSLRDAADK